MKSDDKCPSCNQFIFDDVIRDYHKEDGSIIALLDCLATNKTAYSSTIADYIINLNRGSERMIPNKIIELFDRIKEHHL